jgi:hypothetical protein
MAIVTYKRPRTMLQCVENIIGWSMQQEWWDIHVSAWQLKRAIERQTKKNRKKKIRI